MSSSSATISRDHLLPPPSEQLCYVHCNFCDIVLAVSVPCSSLFKTVTVRCGNCTNLLSVNMRGLLLPAANQLHLSHTYLVPAHQSLSDDLPACPPPSLLMDQATRLLMDQATLTNNNNHSHNLNINLNNNNNSMKAPVKGADHQEELPRSPVVSRPPEKRQRVPSAYNRFIKDEIQRIKAGNPNIAHREAFSAAAKNWAHFPHIHFGLMPDQHLKKASMRQQEGEDILLKDGFFASAATNMGVTPF